MHLMIKKQKCENNPVSSRLHKSFIKKIYNNMEMKLMQDVSFILSIINTGYITDFNEDI
jgi:hypothetical protein